MVDQEFLDKMNAFQQQQAVRHSSSQQFRTAPTVEAMSHNRKRATCNSEEDESDHKNTFSTTMRHQQSSATEHENLHPGPILDSGLNEGRRVRHTPYDNSPKLSAEQRSLLNLIMTGKNVFYTGGAGCGKSTVSKAVLNRMRRQGRRVALTAPTGIAVRELEGITTWSFAGWTPDSMKKSRTELEKSCQGVITRKRLRDLDILIIDEISMVENHFLERLNRIMKVAREDPRAFGGVQIIVSGDFTQLGPIKPFKFCIECGKEMHRLDEETLFKCPEGHGQWQDSQKWAFSSNAWAEAEFENFNLYIVHRQEDKRLKKILHRVRFGLLLSEAQVGLLLKNSDKLEGGVMLCSTRKEVQKINAKKLDRLPGSTYTYYCKDHFKHNIAHKHLEYKGKRSRKGTMYAQGQHKYEAELELKLGTRVILTDNTNVPKGLVNGRQGEIVGFEAFHDGRVPRATTKYAEPEYGVDDRKERLASDGVPTQGGDHIYLRSDQVTEFMHDYRNHHQFWPVVQFENGERHTIYANCLIESLGDTKPYSLLCRTQIPLIPAWAITIHKSQGMTLDKATVDVSGVFAEGQLYVALSRAKSLDGLRVIGFESIQDFDGSNPDVKGFLEQTFPGCTRKNGS